MSEFIQLDDVIWRDVKYLKTPLSASDEQATWSYTLKLPEPLASWDTFSYWERARVESMAKNLSPDMVLYDVGTEQGWCNIVYAHMVKPENMVLIEPTQEFWANIRRTWEQNFGEVKPLGCYSGLLGKEVSIGKIGSYAFDFPSISEGALIDRNAYTYIHDNANEVAQSTLDTTASIFRPPDAITIDVEGAEMNVLAGADEVLRKYQPLVWVSIHPDMMIRDYDYHPEDLRAYMRLHGYSEQHLSTDHEEHWFFYPTGREVKL